MSNFGFLSVHDPALAKLAQRAEAYFAEDPNTSLIKLRQFGELLISHIEARFNLPGESNFAYRIQRLKPYTNKEVVMGFDELRHAGNDAVHGFKGDHHEALHKLKIARAMGIWFHRVFAKDPTFNPGPFLPPPDPKHEAAQVATEMKELLEAFQASQNATAEAELKILQQAQHAALLQEQVAETEAKLAAEQQKTQELLQAAQAAAQNAPQQVQAAQSEAAKLSLPLDEADTRVLIDRQLREAGWEVDSVELRYKKGARPQKGKSVAIAEWPTASGPADYVLFLGTTPVAVVEAKRKNKDVAGSLVQSKRYSRDYQGSTEGEWGEYKIPFLFSANGRPFLQQVKEKSGIWFLDARRPTNRAVPLNGWFTPKGLEGLLAQDIDEAHAKLQKEPLAYLGLRDYQLAAIQAVEGAVATGQDHILVAMATGTGKTKTCIGLVYRLLKSKRFRRILFLVDRNALGEQTHNAFKDFRLEQLQTFTETYDVQGLKEALPEEGTKVHIATIQATVRRALEADTSAPVDQYDCIIIDECHRGYNLDRDMTEGEMTYRDEADYVSQYRRALDHFAAVRIGLTATPALHTLDIFGEPVYTYSYRQAVIDGYLVDHEPPIQIVTKLAKDGMTWQAGSEMQVYNVKTQTIDTQHLADEVQISLEKYNTAVHTENFNRVVCKTLATFLDPNLPGKTLVFCATDSHADLVVRLLKETFDDAPDDAIVKITGASDKPNELIRRYKNEQYPSVAVTVELLTTGVDVPAITNLVFLRRVKSRILYQQMLGRATRLCRDLFGSGVDKDCFHIYDAVELYADMDQFSDMKPVVVQPSFTFDQLVRELSDAPEAEQPSILEQIIAKLQRKKRTIKFENADHFNYLSNMSLDDAVAHLKTLEPSQAAQWFKERSNMVRFLDTAKGDGNNLIISVHEDELAYTTQGFGAGNKGPGDYLEDFADYVRSHLNEIPALVLVTQRPRELTREDLRQLRLALDGAGYTEAQLRSAHKSLTNQDLAASIIGFIRQKALGSPLLPYEVRVDRALGKILASKAWDAPQRQWLERIAKQLKKEVIVDRQALDKGEFANKGGFNLINKKLDGQLESILGSFQDAIWEDVA